MNNQTEVNPNNLKFSFDPQTVIFSYSHDKAQSIAVQYRYQDKNGDLKQISSKPDQEISGFMGDTSTITAATSIKGYTIKSKKIITDPNSTNVPESTTDPDKANVTFGNTPQTVIFIYSPNSETIKVHYIDDKNETLTDTNGKLTIMK